MKKTGFFFVLSTKLKDFAKEENRFFAQIPETLSFILQIFIAKSEILFVVEMDSL